MLTVKDAARILNVSPALVYTLCAQGKLEHERYGLGRGTIRIRPEALDTYRAAARVASPVTRPPRGAAATGVFRELDARRLAAAWHGRTPSADAGH